MVLSTEVLLSVNRISKSFGGAKAPHDVSVGFRAGEVHALLGEDGAGKSTLVKVIAGVVTADAGDVTFPGGSESAVTTGCDFRTGSEGSSAQQN